MPRFKLSTLLIACAAGPAVIAALWFALHDHVPALLILVNSILCSTVGASLGTILLFWRFPWWSVGTASGISVFISYSILLLFFDKNGDIVFRTQPVTGWDQLALLVCMEIIAVEGLVLGFLGAAVARLGHWIKQRDLDAHAGVP